MCHMLVKSFSGEGVAGKSSPLLIYTVFLYTYTIVKITLSVNKFYFNTRTLLVVEHLRIANEVWYLRGRRCQGLSVISLACALRLRKIIH